MKDCIDVLEDAYRELAHGRGVSRTRSDSFSETTRPDALYSLKSMDGIVPKLGVARSGSIPTSSPGRKRAAMNAG